MKANTKYANTTRCLQGAQNSQAKNNYDSVFKRTEKKYCLNAKQYRAAIACISHHMQPDVYAQTVVNSLYFDTPDSQLIRRSLEKPIYKEKFRVRFYGEVQTTTNECGGATANPDQVFIELKKKYKGVVYKRRLALAPSVAREFLQGGRIESTHPLSQQEKQVAMEIQAFLNRWENLQPAMITRCVRNAYKDLNSQLRITFDSQLYAARPVGDIFAFQMEKPEMKLLGQNQVLMEIKQAGGLPLWLVHMLSENRAYPTSFSKYGAAYKQQLKNNSLQKVNKEPLPAKTNS